MIRESLLIGASYLLGSIPFGLIVTRRLTGIDVREHGSGNIGTTNVFRVAGKPAGTLVFMFDVGKGLAPPLVASALGMHIAWQVGAGMAAVIGHSLSPFLRFKGGKGIATSAGVLLGVMWPVGVSAIVLWALLIAATGYVSLGSVFAAASLSPFSFTFYPGDNVRLAFAVAAGLLALAKHRGNIQRLFQGTESCFRTERPPQWTVAVSAVLAAIVLVALPVARYLMR